MDSTSRKSDSQHHYLTPTELAREIGKERREVIVLCLELGVPILSGRICKEEFIAAYEVGRTCPRCKGSGEVEVPHPSGWEEYGTIYGECGRCNGTGRVLTDCRTEE